MVVLFSCLCVVWSAKSSQLISTRFLNGDNDNYKSTRKKSTAAAAAAVLKRPSIRNIAEAAQIK